MGSALALVALVLLPFAWLAGGSWIDWLPPPYRVPVARLAAAQAALAVKVGD